MIEARERNFSSRVAYDGTNYAGFQLQPNAPTIQGELETVVAKLFDVETRVHGASRTDSGVHAVGQVVSFRAATLMPPEDLERAANALLPPDIRVGPVLERDDDFHARYSAKGKRYVYRIYRGPRESPFLNRFSLWVWGDLDEEGMRKAAKLFTGEHDFRSYSSRLHENETPVKRLERVAVSNADEMLEITIEGSGFLYHMARSIAGAMLEIGIGGISVEKTAGWLLNPELNACSYVLPAKGLYLMEVFY